MINIRFNEEEIAAFPIFSILLNPPLTLYIGMICLFNALFNPGLELIFF